MNNLSVPPQDSDSQPSASSGSWRAPWNRRDAIDVLRVGVGLVWLANLIFIVNPENHYWNSFSNTALLFAPSTLGGPGLAQFVAANPLFFSWGIALLTVYLAVALLLGFTTRIACFAGSFFSAILLATQFGNTFLFPGGTDVGAHPLYLLVYTVLVVGGAGRSHSVDRWIQTALETRRKRIATSGRVSRVPWATALPPQTLLTYFVAGTLISLGVGFGLVVALPVAPSSGGNTTPVGPIHYVNLSVAIDPLNGWPQFTPANFSVPTGRAVFTIVDRDMPMAWSECPCHVGGTVGGTELINGTSVGVVGGSNVAHTFNIPVMGLQVLSPGQSIVQFSVDLLQTGLYQWICFAPCGTGADPYTSPPMGVHGFMTGTMNVT